MWFVIEYKRVMSKHELYNMNNQIILLQRSMYQLSTTCNNKRNEIAYQIPSGYETTKDILYGDEK
jgi:hypothetical protein